MTETFSKFIGTPFEKDIRPGIPPGAQLSPDSEVEPGKCGKIPGFLGPKGWAGLHKSQQNHPVHPALLERWDGWETANVVLRGGNFIRIDIDTDEEALAETIRAHTEEHLGRAPVRGRPGSCHCLLVYRHAPDTPPIRKQTIAWRMPGDDPMAKPQHLLEIIGDSGNMMIEGVHPSGHRYQYSDGVDLIAWGGDNLSVVEVHRISEFVDAVIAVIIEHGGIIASHTSAGLHDGSRLPVGDAAHLAPSVEVATEALNSIPCEELDYDDWIRVTAAFKAATGGTAEAWDAYVNWSLGYPGNDEGVADAKWESVQESALGANWLFAKAAEWGFSLTGHLFDDLRDVEPGHSEVPSTTAAESKASDPDGARDLSGDGSVAPPAQQDAAPAPKRERWEKRYVYIEPQKEFVDLQASNLQRYDLQAFKLKHPLFSPWAPKANAVMRYLQSQHKTVCDGYTYLPGAPRLVDDAGRRLLNRWSPGPELLERTVTDDEIRPWLDHVEYIITDAVEREVFFDWLAHLVQRRQPKTNFAVLIGGAQGIGKNLMIEPIIRVLGPGNARSAAEPEIKDKYTTWLAERELVIMEEIYGLSEEAMNRLKMYIAAPPYTVPVNEKHVKHYEVPNVARFLAFTNQKSALQLSDDDRRWFIVWSSAEPKDARYYITFASWCEQNVVLIGSWLAQRDISAFAAQARAPMTAAKREMFADSLGSLDYYVHEAIADGRQPFDDDLISVEDVVIRLPFELRDLRPVPNEKSMAVALRKAGARRLERVSLGRELESTGASRTVLWAIRRQSTYARMENKELVALFWKQRDQGCAADDPFQRQQRRTA
jgi:hypothetical protein